MFPFLWKKKNQKNKTPKPNKQKNENYTRAVSRPDPALDDIANRPSKGL